MNVVRRCDFENRRYILRMSGNKNDLSISEQKWIKYNRIKNECDKMQKWIEKLGENEVK